jgi:hypothetical protein
MIRSCTQFHLQAPHLDPADAISVPELIDGNSGGKQSLIFRRSIASICSGEVDRIMRMCSLGIQ